MISSRRTWSPLQTSFARNVVTISNISLYFVPSYFFFILSFFPLSLKRRRNIGYKLLIQLNIFLLFDWSNMFVRFHRILETISFLDFFFFVKWLVSIHVIIYSSLHYLRNFLDVAIIFRFLVRKISRVSEQTNFLSISVVSRRCETKLHLNHFEKSEKDDNRFGSRYCE